MYSRSWKTFPNIQCVGLDPHLESLDKSLEGLEYFESISNNQTSFLSGSAYELPFKDSTFDLIICSEVLEHLHEYRNAYR
jgi:ubiquinone/menaquinone biosynthesis C-methylase UbiE